MPLIINNLNNFINKSVANAMLNLVRKRSTVRNLSASKTEIIKEKISQNHFIKLYEFPMIKMLRIIGRFKLYHTALTTLAVPLSIYMHHTNISEDAYVMVCAIGFGGCLAFYSSGFFVNNLIGAVYSNEAVDTVMLSYIGFWGKRVDKICPASDIVSLQNQPLENNLLKLSTIRFFSSSETLLLASEHGCILLPQAFDKIFFRENINIPNKTLFLSSETKAKGKVGD